MASESQALPDSQVVQLSEGWDVPPPPPVRRQVTPPRGDDECTCGDRCRCPTSAIIATATAVAEAVLRPAPPPPLPLARYQIDDYWGVFPRCAAGAARPYGDGGDLDADALESWLNDWQADKFGPLQRRDMVDRGPKTYWRHALADPATRERAEKVMRFIYSAHIEVCEHPGFREETSGVPLVIVAIDGRTWTLHEITTFWPCGWRRALGRALGYKQRADSLPTTVVEQIRKLLVTETAAARKRNAVNDVLPESFFKMPPEEEPEAPASWAATRAQRRLAQASPSHGGSGARGAGAGASPGGH